MAAEPLHIFDPRRTMHVQGFSGRAATTTIHDATETGLSVSGIFQAAEDFAVLCLYNAYDHFNHLRLKHLPRTDLSGLRIEFDIEYDHALDGAMRFDAPKFPCVSWDAITFVTGVGDLHEVKLLDHATVISRSETPASLQLDLSAEAPALGIDYYHVFFRDTRYTVAHTDCIRETQLTQDVQGGGETWMYVGSVESFRAGGWVYIERTGTNEELVFLLEVDQLQNRLRGYVTISHPAGSYVTLRVEGYHIAERFAGLINDPTTGDIPGRYGPCQATAITAEGGATGVRTGPGDPIGSYLRISFTPDSGYGKLGNLDRVLATCGHQGEGQLSGDWLQSGARFTGGDTDKKYRITLDFTQELRDKQNNVVPMNDCRKIYMVFAPRFERIEEEIEDGCFLTADAAPGDTILQVDDTSKLTGGRYFIGDSASEERLLLVSVDSATQITLQRGYQNSTPTSWPAGTRLKKLSPATGVDADIEWRVTVSNITVTGDRSLKVGGAAPRIEESDARCKYEGYWENYAYGAGWPSQWWSAGHARRTTTGEVTIRYSYPSPHYLYLGAFLNTDCGQISVSVDGDTATTHGLYLNEYGGTTACIPLRSGLSGGIHRASITATGGIAVNAGVIGLANSGVTPGTYPKVTVDAKGRVTAGAALSGSDLPAHQHVASDITSGALALARGGTGANLSATGPAFLRQESAGNAVTVGAIGLADLPAQLQQCGPFQTVGGAFENMAKASEDFSASVWDRNSGSCSVTPNSVIAPDGNLTADTVTAVTDTPVIQQQIAGLADGGTYTFYVWARVPSGTRKVSLAIVNNAYTEYLAGPTQITLTTSWQRFKITGALAAGQSGLWIVVRQYAANGDDWTTGDIHVWGACLQQGNDPKKGYARTWASQTPHVNAGLAAGPTVIAAPDNTTSPLKIHGPGSNLADSTLLELTANGELMLAGGSGNGYRFAALMPATNPSGWSGVLKVKTPAGATLGYILLYSNP